MILIRLKNNIKVPSIFSCWLQFNRNGRLDCLFFAILILLVNQISVYKSAPLDLTTSNSTNSSINIQLANLTKYSENNNNFTFKIENSTQVGDLINERDIKTTNETKNNQSKIEINGENVKLGESNGTSITPLKGEEAPKEEPKKEEPKKTEAPKEEPKKEEPKKAEAPKEEPKKEEPKKTEAPKEEPKKEEPKKTEAPKEEPKKEEPKKTEAPKEEPKKEEEAKKNENEGEEKGAEDEEEKNANDYDAPPEDDSLNQIKSPNKQEPDSNDSPSKQKEQGPIVPKPPSSENIIEDDEESSGGFLKFFLLISGFLVFGYLAYHNKSKIMGLLIEGRAGKNQRRFNSRVYNRLENVADTKPNINK